MTTDEAGRKLGAIYDKLPWTDRTLQKRIQANEYDFQLLNDTGSACEYRVITEGRDIGLIIYSGGRKLCCHTLVQP